MIAILLNHCLYWLSERSKLCYAGFADEALNNSIDIRFKNSSHPTITG
jgi:hypothetical protein